jgi:hypothetical protein
MNDKEQKQEISLGSLILGLAMAADENADKAWVKEEQEYISELLEQINSDNTIQGKKMC